MDTESALEAGISTRATGATLEHFNSEPTASPSSSDVEGERHSFPQTHTRTPAAANAEAAKAAVFQQLRPICASLLPLRGDPPALAPALDQLAAVLQGADRAGLRACLDYVLFPLLFAVDSVAATRTKPAGAGEASQAAPAFPAAASDRVAERLLGALMLLLRRCPATSGEQATELLRRLLPAAQLPRDAAGEEVRHRALQGVEALLAGLQPQGTTPSPVAEALRVLDMAPLVATTASTFINAAEGEIVAGASGSKALRGTALRGLRLLISAVADGDGLAFFVPGIVTGLAKALIAAGSSHGARSRVGPAAGSAAAIMALQGLLALLQATLGDAHARAVLAAAEELSPRAAAAGGSATAALEALQNMALQAQANGLAPAQPAASAPRGGGAQQGKARSMRVQRDAGWLHATAQRVAQVLGLALLPLCGHPRPTVRAALASSATALLETCGAALQDSQQLLLEVVLTLAQDGWPQVADPCQAWLLAHRPAAPALTAGPTGSTQSRLPTGGQLLQWRALERLILQLLGGLSAAVRGGGDDAAPLYARRLSMALQAAPAQQVAASVLQSPVHLATLAAALCDCFAFERASAALLLYAAPAEGAAYTTGDAAALPAPPAADPTSSTPANGAAARFGQPGATAAAEGSSAGQGETSAVSTDAGGGAVVLLPRMPVGLSHIASLRAYQAVAGVARAAGRVAAAADVAASPATGGTALRGLVDHLVRMLQRAAEQHTSAGSGWQEEVAAVAAVLNEVLFGASPAWHDDNLLAVQLPPQTSAPSSTGFRGVSEPSELEALVRMALDEYTREELCGLPTHAAMQRNVGDASGHDPLTLQELGENALLVRVLLEGTGAFARALGPRFAANGRLLRTALLPTLERLGDPCAMVAAAAGAAVQSMCTHCGYGSLQRLAAANGDYIVDSLCRQLRHLDSHPRAPQLFAALLQQSGAAPSLLPLLAEPARAALQGLSVTSRSKQPQHVAAFLQALLEIVGGAATDAAAVRAATHSLALEIDAELAAAQARRSAGGWEAGASAGIEEVADYFRQHAETKQEAENNDLPEDPEDEEQQQVELESERAQAVGDLRRRNHADAVLAAAAADAASPLLLSSSLKVVLLGVDVVVGGCRALRDSSAVLDMMEEIGAATKRPHSIEPVAPETPRLLPAVHVLWAPLIAALKDGRVAVVERLAGAVAEVTHMAGGDFLARRFRAEAWPLLAHLLQEGPTHRRGPGVGRDEAGLALAALQRVRVAVLRCITAVAASDSASPVLLTIAPQVAAAAGAHLGNASAPAVREAAAQALVALSDVDRDAVWLELMHLQDADSNGPALPHPQPPAGADFPPFRKIFPVDRGATVPAGCGARAQRLLGQLSPRVRWHSRAALGRAAE